MIKNSNTGDFINSACMKTKYQNVHSEKYNNKWKHPCILSEKESFEFQSGILMRQHQQDVIPF